MIHTKLINQFGVKINVNSKFGVNINRLKTRTNVANGTQAFNNRVPNSDSHEIAMMCYAERLNVSDSMLASEIIPGVLSTLRNAIENLQVPFGRS